jgi:hypothetical protein
MEANKGFHIFLRLTNFKITMKHKTVRVKVNAYVDEKISPVIEALSMIDGFVTYQSCENMGNRGRAFIAFSYKDEYDNWRGLGELCETLSKALLDFEYANVSVNWQLGSASCPHGHFEFETATADDIAKAIRKLSC